MNNNELLEIVLDTFHNFLEALEEYIGKLDHYKNWNSQRQIYRRTITDSNDTLAGFEDLVLTDFPLVIGSIRGKSADFRKKIQDEYHK